MLTRSSVAAPTRAETKVSVPPVKVKAAKAIDARLSPYGDREGPLVPGERGGMFSRRNHVEASTRAHRPPYTGDEIVAVRIGFAEARMAPEWDA